MAPKVMPNASSRTANGCRVPSSPISGKTILLVAAAAATNRIPVIHIIMASLLGRDALMRDFFYILLVVGDLVVRLTMVASRRAKHLHAYYDFERHIVWVGDFLRQGYGAPYLKCLLCRACRVISARCQLVQVPRDCRTLALRLGGNVDGGREPECRGGLFCTACHANNILRRCDAKELCPMGAVEAFNPHGAVGIEHSSFLHLRCSPIPL